MAARGRRAVFKGAQHPGAKLTREQVQEIRASCAFGECAPSIAERYGISTSQVYSIRDRRTWGED